MGKNGLKDWQEPMLLYLRDNPLQRYLHIVCDNMTILASANGEKWTKISLAGPDWSYYTEDHDLGGIACGNHLRCFW